MPDDELTADMSRKAEAFAAAAAERGETLDFSLESLVVLDALLDHLFGRRWLGARGGRLDSGRYGRMVEPVGAYVGETLRRTAGGEWGVHDEFGPGLRLESGTWTFPVAKAQKRFDHGHEDSLALYGQVLTEMS